MGMESVLVSFTGFNGDIGQLSQHLGRLIPIFDNSAAAMTGSSTCWVLFDSKHKFEVEIINKKSDFSLRFALCNPRSISDVFISLIRQLMSECQLIILVCEDSTIIPETPMSLTEFNLAVNDLLEHIEVRRKEWKQMFGEEEMPATCVEAFQKFILPLSVKYIA